MGISVPSKFPLDISIRSRIFSSVSYKHSVTASSMQEDKAATLSIFPNSSDMSSILDFSSAISSSYRDRHVQDKSIGEKTSPGCLDAVCIEQTICQTAPPHLQLNDRILFFDDPLMLHIPLS